MIIGSALVFIVFTVCITVLSSKQGSNNSKVAVGIILVLLLILYIVIALLK